MIIPALLFVLAISSCGPTRTPAPANTETPIPAPVDTLTPTITPVPDNIWIPLGQDSVGLGHNRTINALVVDPRHPMNIYSGAEDDVYRTTDGGKNWIAGNLGFAVEALAIDPAVPSTIYAGTKIGGLFKSEDSGANWKPMNSGPIDTAFARVALANGICAIAVDPETTSTVYVGTNTAGGIYKSMDGGITWVDISRGSLKDSSPCIIRIDPDTTNVIYAAGLAGLQTSADGGGSWSSLNRSDPTDTSFCGTFGTEISALAIVPQNSSIIYAGSDNSCVAKSTDTGKNWITMSGKYSKSKAIADYDPYIASDPILALVISPERTTTLYAGGYFGVFQSADGGETWSVMNKGLKDLPDNAKNVENGVSVLAIDPGTPSILFAGTVNGGVYKIKLGSHIDGENAQSPAAPSIPSSTTCPYQADSDQATITGLILKEAEAVNTKDIAIIEAIFAPDAHILVGNNESRDPVKYYSDGFLAVDFIGSTHNNIRPYESGITGDAARFISGGSGTVKTKDGGVYPYNNTDNEFWTLRKNLRGCWAITELISK